MPTATQHPVFLYPTSRRFPFDETCERIVRELERRRWQVPGITVKLHTYGTGDWRFRHVETIEGADFRLWFCGMQRYLGYDLNDIAAVSELTIPGRELHVYEDGSTPSLYVYVGGDWQRDTDRFLHHSKINSRLHRERRWYLHYSGTPYLVPDSDLGRDYLPEGAEPTRYDTAMVFAEFTAWLTDHVLTPILAVPAPDGPADDTAAAPTPFPASIGPLFCFGDRGDLERIRTDPGRLEPPDRYGLRGDGWRLLPLGTRHGEPVPDVAYAGFLWCGVGTVDTTTPAETLRVAGMPPSSGQGVLFRVAPNRADGIYVADHGHYEQRRQELAAADPDSKWFTDEQVADFQCARARTIVPITQYHGGFADPVVLITRDLDRDEIEGWMLMDRQTTNRP
jgi:hypothetical protein